MNLLSLQDWLRIADRHKELLRPIPAHLIGEAATQDLLRGIWEHELTPDLQKLLQSAENDCQKNHILRWDPGVSDSLKHWMGQGHGAQIPPRQIRQRILEGNRLMDILLEYGQPTVPLWRRPWVQAQTVGGYPVEFRAFSWEGTVKGVSNYYPQRDLPERFQPQARQVYQKAEELTREVTSFTLDFLLDQQGELRMVEGGPPHHQDPRKGGAHPCCFPPGQIEGIRLTRHPNAPEH